MRKREGEVKWFGQAAIPEAKQSARSKQTHFKQALHYFIY